MMRAWEISQAYKVVQGVCRFCAMRLDCHKNSDLGSEVSMVTGLNSTMLCLIESVALLTKSIGIVTPLILSIVVVVVLRLISYMKRPRDHIVHRLPNRSVSYMGFVMRGREKKRKEAVQCICIVYEVQSRCNIWGLHHQCLYRQ